MKVTVIKKHPSKWEPLPFPTFAKGSPVAMAGQADTQFLHWWACEIGGVETYVPESFVQNGVLARAYNPTELVQNAGDILEVQEIVYAWLLAKNAQGETGWIPAEVVSSIKPE